MNLLKSISAYLGVARSFHWVTGENQIMRHELEPQKKNIYVMLISPSWKTGLRVGATYFASLWSEDH